MMKNMGVVYLLLLVIVNAYEWHQEYPIDSSIQAPDARYHHTFTLVGDDTGVLVGGFDFNYGGLFLSDTWLYQISAKKWKFALNSSDLTRAYFSANNYQDQVVIFGGVGKTDIGVQVVHGDVWRYSLGSNNWTRDIFASPLAPIIVRLLPRQYHASAIVDDTLYIFGGHTQAYGWTTNDLLAYNLINKTWTILQEERPTERPYARQGHTLHAYYDPIYGPSLLLFGGYPDRPWTGGFNDTWQYVINTNSWVLLSNTTSGPSPRSGHNGAVINNSTLFIYGGMTTENINAPTPPYDVYYSDVWYLKLYGGGSSEWVNVFPDSGGEPGRRQGHKIVVVDDVIYSAAGYIQYVGLGNDVWSLNTTDTTAKLNAVIIG